MADGPNLGGKTRGQTKFSLHKNFDIALSELLEKTEEAGREF